MDESQKHSRVQVLLVGFVVQTVVGFLDYATGYQFELDVLYFIPVSICAWHLNRSEVVALATIGALTWGYADICSGHHYGSEAFLYWNILVRIGSLVVVGLVVKNKNLLNNFLKMKNYLPF